MSRRESILTEATKLIATHGYPGVSTEDIGASVGISGPSVYNHFPAKSDILAAAMLRGSHPVSRLTNSLRIWRYFTCTAALLTPSSAKVSNESNRDKKTLSVGFIRCDRWVSTPIACPPERLLTVKSCSRDYSR